MQKYILYLLPLLLTGCGVIKTKYQTPYLIPNVSLQGDHWLSGSVIQSSKKRYWLTYEKALRAEGFQLADSYEKKGNQQNLKVPGAFLTYDLDQNKEFPLDQRQKVNKKLFNEGYIYALSICTGYFQQADYTKSQRSFARKETNISGGLLAAALGLAEASVKTVSGVGVAFSALDSSFDSYDTSFVVSPQLGLLERAILTEMSNVYESNKNTEFNSVSQVLVPLLKISNVCSQTGMQAYVDQSVQDNITNSTYTIPNLHSEALNRIREAKEIAEAIKPNSSNTKNNDTTLPDSSESED
ncbi:hypothetical protein [Acinetobacter cumulans]|uniref:hypothetical protein n=1 Tax=Acinetobacter cumulans TaxID=2136182 RepID=UPI00144462B1|nr:hypothetical protein [Acinetobacter cumulans]